MLRRRLSSALRCVAVVGDTSDSSGDAAVLRVSLAYDASMEGSIYRERSRDVACAADGAGQNVLGAGCAGHGHAASLSDGLTRGGQSFAQWANGA